ncbi:hypothetical protein ZPAH1_orf00004 [Aeromonas phage ZPAH1]|nr:hypothetical protein ZPAH1_orf00004 [Aeromonas phage ZPAH1]
MQIKIQFKSDGHMNMMAFSSYTPLANNLKNTYGLLPFWVKDNGQDYENEQFVISKKDVEVFFDIVDTME